MEGVTPPGLDEVAFAAEKDPNAERALGFINTQGLASRGFPGSCLALLANPIVVPIM